MRGWSFVASTNLISLLSSLQISLALRTLFSSRAISRPSFRNIGHIFTDSLVCLTSFFSIPRTSTRILTQRRPMELAYPEKSYDRSGAESFDIDHQTHPEPHNLVRGCHPRQHRPHSTAATPFSLNNLWAVFQAQIHTNLGVHAIPFQICPLHTMPSNCFGLDGRALASALPLPTLLSEALLAPCEIISNAAACYLLPSRHSRQHHVLLCYAFGCKDMEASIHSTSGNTCLFPLAFHL